MPNGKGATLTTAQVSGTNAATAVVAQNLARVNLIVTNNGTSVAVVGETSAVTATNGHVIPANTTVYFDSYTGPLYVIMSGTLATTLSYAEY